MAAKISTELSHFVITTTIVSYTIDWDRFGDTGEPPFSILHAIDHDASFRSTAAGKLNLLQRLRDAQPELRSAID